MNRIFKCLCAGLIVSIIFSFIPFEAECNAISNEVFRLHILANSDSNSDQALKIKVRDSVLEYTENIYKNSDSKDGSIHCTASNLQNIADIAQQTVYNNGYKYQVKAEITNMYFNTRYYDNVTMPAGNYDALRITIGEAKGKNWWCVMYPSLCVGSATNYDALKDNVSDNQYEILNSGTEYEIKFKAVEYFDSIKSFFINNF